jgi:branched-chain amino acid transport system permease protein
MARRLALGALLIGCAALLDALLPRLLDPYMFQILIYIGINITLAVSLNLVNGITGQFSIGHAGFMAIGAYVSAYITYFFGPGLATATPSGGPPPGIAGEFVLFGALLAGGLAAAGAGWVVGLPSLRLKGDYLAIVTLGFGEIIRVLILNIETVGGARGFAGVPPLQKFSPVRGFFWVFLLAVATVIVSVRLVNSSYGRAMLAVREDEVAAEASGVNTTQTKVGAFVVGAFFAGMAGGLLGHYLQYLNPAMFTFVKSFEILIMVVLGGMGSITGSVLAAAIMTILPEALRGVKDYTPHNIDPRMVLFSLLLIVLMLTRPTGLLGHREIWDVVPWRRRRHPAGPNSGGAA